MMNKNNFLKVAACAVLVCGAQSFGSHEPQKFNRYILPVVLKDYNGNEILRFDNDEALMASEYVLVQGSEVVLRNESLNVVRDSGIVRHWIPNSDHFYKKRDIEFNKTDKTFLKIPTRKLVARADIAERHGADVAANAELYSSWNYQKTGIVRAVESAPYVAVGVGALVGIAALARSSTAGLSHNQKQALLVGHSAASLGMVVGVAKLAQHAGLANSKPR